MIQSTAGISKPRAATSVQSKIPFSALQNSKNVFVRFCCFCRPCYDMCEQVIGNHNHHSLYSTYMQIQHRNVNVVHQLSMVLDRITA